MTQLADTIKFLTEHGKTPADVKAVYVADIPDYAWGTWEEYAAIAATTEYEPNPSLYICGDGWFVERDFNGSGWFWRYEQNAASPIFAELTINNVCR